MPKLYTWRHKANIPPEAVNIDRRSIWGNPYREREFGLELCVQLYENSLLGIWNPIPIMTATRWRHLSKETIAQTLLDKAYKAHLLWTASFLGPPIARARETLYGKDLVCWDLEWDGSMPGPGLVCHGVPLLIHANRLNE